MPAGDEHEQASGALRNLQEGGVAIVESRQNSRAGQPVGFEFPMLPEVDLGEIAETRIGKRRKQWMLEINLTEHRVAVGWGFRGAQIVHARQPADRWGSSNVFQNEQGRAAVAQELVGHVELILVQNVIGNQETSARDVGLG